MELCHCLLLLLLFEKRVNLLVRLALLLLLLRSPLTLIPLFWQRGSKMMVLGRLAIKSQKALMSLRARRQAARLTFSASRLSSVQDVLPAPLAVEAPTAVAVTLSPSPPPVFLIQEATLVAAKESRQLLWLVLLWCRCCTFVECCLVLLWCPLLPLWLQWSFPLLFWQRHCLLPLLAPVSPWIICTPLVMLIHRGCKLLAKAEDPNWLCVNL